MYRAIVFELQKILKSRFLWGLLAFFLVANVYIFTNAYFHIYVMTEGENTIYDIASGNITEDKLDFVINNYEKYGELIASGEYSDKGNQDGTYTGYIMGDYNTFQTMYEGLKSAYDYKGYVDRICSKARENVEFYQNSNNSYGVRKYSMIYRSYANREINDFYIGDVVENYFSYDFSTVFMFLILVVGIGNSLLLEKENNMYEIVETVSFGNKKRVLAKILAIMLFCFGVVAIFVLCDLILIQLQYHTIDNWTSPVYALESYRDTPLNCTVGQFFVIWVLCRVIVMVFFSLVVYAMYMIFLNGIKTIAYSILIFCGFVMICIQNNLYFNPIALLNVQEIVNNCEVCNVLGIPFYYYEVVFGLVVLVTIGLGSVLVLWGSKSSLAVRTKIKKV